MSNENISIHQYLRNYNNGMYADKDVSTQCDAGWYDWFCDPTKLAAKTVKLTEKLKDIVYSTKIDRDKMYVWFKNNCPMNGPLYDDFRISDLETGDVVYTIIPRSSHSGKAEVWGSENKFDGPLVRGTWRDVRKFFGCSKR